VGGFALGWGESLVWDERRQRLYFADCAARTIHWLDGGDGDAELGTYRPPSMPTGLVPTEDGRIVAVLDDGLHVVDVDAGEAELLSPYPEEIGGRCNDACADLEGNLVTGRLNLGPAEGSTWWFSATDGWRLLDPDISNTNGPAVAELDGTMTLIVGDTSADYFAYDYDPVAGAVGPRRVFGATGDLDGHPDGSTLDADGGLWCALVQGGQLARFTTAGLDRTLRVPTPNPTDVTFGGRDLDRLYVVSIGGDGELDGALLVVDGLGVTGRPEPRFRLA
jgi:sugar lactone lactonase YvrE